VHVHAGVDRDVDLLAEASRDALGQHGEGEGLEGWA
jgi:hypothetical protein